MMSGDMQEFFRDNPNWYEEYKKRMNYLDASVSVPMKLLETLEEIVAEHLTSFYVRGVQPNYKDYKAKQELSRLLVEAGRKLNASTK